MNRRVSVWKYVRIGKKWRYCKPAVGKNGKIKPDWVIVRGKEEHHPEGNFYLQRNDGNKEIWKRIGPNAQEAVNAADFESTYLAARAKGIPVKPIDTPILSIQSGCAWLVGRRETFKSARDLRTLRAHYPAIPRMELEWWAASDQSDRSGPEGLS